MGSEAENLDDGQHGLGGDGDDNHEEELGLGGKPGDGEGGDGDGGGDLGDEGKNDHDIDPEVWAKLSDVEREQIPKGWRPRDMWDGDPDDWVSAQRFKQTGDMISQLGQYRGQVKDLEKNFEERLKNATMFQNAMVENLRAELTEARRAAIKQGDVDKVDELDQKLGKLPDEEASEDQAKPGQFTPDEQAELYAWKRENPWIFDESSPKYKFANNAFLYAKHAENKSMSDALAYVESEVERAFPSNPNVNPRRSEAGLGEGGGKGGGKKSAAIVPQSQWTDEEKKVAQSLKGKFTDEQIAQMVTDSRRAQ